MPIRHGGKAATTSVGSPLLEQGLLLVSSFGTVEGRPADLSGETLEQTLRPDLLVLTVDGPLGDDLEAEVRRIEDGELEFNRAAASASG